MPSRLRTPVLSVDADRIFEVDIRNAENLYGMWNGTVADDGFKRTDDRLTTASVFSKCAESIEGGKRLENLSWRLWTLETFGHKTQSHLAKPSTADVSSFRSSHKDVPDLSASVDSASSHESGRVDSGVKFAPHLYKSTTTTRGSNELSSTQSKGREKQFASHSLSKMVASIHENQALEPLSPSLRIPEIQPRAPTDLKAEQADQEEADRDSQRSSDSCYSNATVESNGVNPSVISETSVSSNELMKSSSVVRGFSPSHISSSLRSKTQLAPKSTHTALRNAIPKTDSSKRASAIFTLGGSSGEDESSFEDRITQPRPQRSSLTEGLGKPLETKKQTSFREIVESKTIYEHVRENEDAIETDDEVSDGAIDDEDDDEEEWEDSDMESGRSSVEEKPMFQRVDSRPNLVSRRSMLTTLMHEPERAAALANAASQSSPVIRRSRTSSPNGPSVPGSLDAEDSTLAMKAPGVPRSKPIIVTTSNTNSPLLSPRTTRRNMLNAELTESLRRHLLWERQQKSTTAHAVYKRRHTAQADMAHLKEYPGDSGDLAQKEDTKNNSWNPCFDHGPWEYHTKGW